MAPTPSPEPAAAPERARPAPAESPAELPAELGPVLVDLARRALSARLLGAPFELDLDRLPAALARPGAAFVTLERRGELRGCIGTLEAHRPLAEDVVENACAAAFRDPRFAPLTADELDGLDLSVSVLGAPVALPAASEAELLAALEPGVDGLIVEDGYHRATFLPAVWESLPEPRDFLAHLWRKAGLPRGHWSPTLTCRRYRVASFRGPAV